MKVIIVDDDKNIRFIGVAALEYEPGWIVFEADSGQNALQLAEKEQPDLILLDMMMPEMDGREVLSRLKDNPLTKNINVIFMTAKVQPQDIDEYGDLDVVGVITKPFDPMKLAAQIKTVLTAGKV